MDNFRLIVTLLVVTLAFTEAVHLPFDIKDPGMNFVRTLDPHAQFTQLSARPYGTIDPSEPSPPSMVTLLEMKDKMVSLMREDKEVESFEQSEDLIKNLNWSISETQDLVPVYLMMATRYDRFVLLQLLNRSVEALIELIELGNLVDYEGVGNLKNVDRVFYIKLDELAQKKPQRILQVSLDASESDLRESAKRLLDILQPERAKHLSPAFQYRFELLRDTVERACNGDLGLTL